LLALCAECMRVCPIAQRAPQANVIARTEGMRAKVAEAEAQAREDQAKDQASASGGA